MEAEVQGNLNLYNAQRPEPGYGLSLIVEGGAWQGTKAKMIRQALTDMLKIDGSARDIVVYEEDRVRRRAVWRIHGDVTEVDDRGVRFEGGHTVEWEDILSIHF